MSNTNIDLSFTLEFADYQALVRVVERNVRERLVAVTCWVGIGGIGIGIGLLVFRWIWVATLGFEGDRADQQVIVILSMVAFAGFFFEVLMKRHWRDVVEGSQILGATAFSASADGFWAQAGLIKFGGPWSALVRTHDTTRHLFLFIARRQAIIIPHSAFKTSEDKAAILAWAEQGARNLRDQAALTGHGPT